MSTKCDLKHSCEGSAVLDCLEFALGKPFSEAERSRLTLAIEKIEQEDSRDARTLYKKMVACLECAPFMTSSDPQQRQKAITAFEQSFDDALNFWGMYKVARALKNTWIHFYQVQKRRWLSSEFLKEEKLAAFMGNLERLSVPLKISELEDLYASIKKEPDLKKQIDSFLKLGSILLNIELSSDERSLVLAHFENHYKLLHPKDSTLQLRLEDIYLTCRRT